MRTATIKRRVLEGDATIPAWSGWRVETSDGKHKNVPTQMAGIRWCLALGYDVTAFHRATDWGNGCRP